MILRVLQAVFAVWLAVAPAAGFPRVLPVQGENEQEPEFFSGTVSGLDERSITVERTTLGESERRSFLLTPETRVEGQLRINARVTVRYRGSAEGDVAIHIIVRGAASAFRW